MEVTIYHNPRCSKSRDTLALLEEKGIAPNVVEYLKTPPTKTELRRILTLLKKPAQEILRTGEEEYKALNLKEIKNDDEILDAIIAHPKLLERPIVVAGNKACIGRPPENVVTIL